MKNVTPRRPSGPRIIARIAFYLLGFLYAAWETRALWRELAFAIRNLRPRV